MKSSTRIQGLRVDQVMMKSSQRQEHHHLSEATDDDMMILEHLLVLRTRTYSAVQRISLTIIIDGDASLQKPLSTLYFKRKDGTRLQYIKHPRLLTAISIPSLSGSYFHFPNHTLYLSILFPQFEIPRLKLLKDPFGVVLSLNSEQFLSVLGSVATENVLGDICVILVDVAVVKVARLEHNVLESVSSNYWCGKDVRNHSTFPRATAFSIISLAMLITVSSSLISPH